jgi:Short C-terminal domain/Phospholipase_D-nuclease N-terminal
LHVLAYDYPLLGIFWTMMIWFFWVAWIVLLFRVVADIFRSHDLGGGAKALWAIFVVVAPWLGVLMYLIVRGHGMTDRDIQNLQAREAAFRSQVQAAAGTSGGAAEELSKLSDLKAQGVITEAEFAQQKAKLLA